MLKNLPTWIDPKHLAFQNYNLKGYVAFAQMSRLQESLCEIKGEAYVDWLFTMDNKQRPNIQGNLQAWLPMLCQRCLQPVLIEVDTKVALVILINASIAEAENHEELPAGYEALTLTNTPTSLITLVEDELILALPIVAKHTTCLTNEYQLSKNQVEDVTFQASSPFHILSNLKIDN